MEVKIEKLDHYGRGIGKINNKTVFVNNALENEIVEIKITKEKKNFCEATVCKYIKTSEKRKIPICPYYELCGGCQLLHLSYEEQLKFKENKVKEILKKFANIKEDIIKPIVKSEEEYYYRNKITLQVDKKIGLYQEKSNDIIPINYCYLVSNGMNDSIKDLIKEDFSSYKGNIVIKETTQKDKLIFYNLNKYYSNPKFINKDYILEKMGNFTFKISPQSFFQVNTKQAIKLYQKVKEYADLKGKEIILDLYCGTGTIGIFLSEKAKKVIGIEICKEAVEDAKENSKINQVDNCEFFCGDAQIEIEKIKEKVDIIIVDPPRSGLTEREINYFKRLNPQKIIYVSCDPITFARDLNILKNDYEIKEITPFDLFPQTYHVECVCILKHK